MSTDERNIRYRKKPVVIEAMQVPRVRDTGQPEWEALCEWLEPCEDWVSTGKAIIIGTLEGTMRAGPGDWVIKGVKGEFYPCKPDIFEETYERA